MNSFRKLKYKGAFKTKDVKLPASKPRKRSKAADKAAGEEKILEEHGSKDSGEDLSGQNDSNTETAGN